MNLERLVEYILNDFWEDIFEKEPEELSKPCARVLLGKFCVEGNLAFIHVCMDSSLGYPLCISKHVTNKNLFDMIYYE